MEVLTRFDIIKPRAVPARLFGWRARGFNSPVFWDRTTQGAFSANLFFEGSRAILDEAL